MRKLFYWNDHLDLWHWELANNTINYFYAKKKVKSIELPYWFIEEQLCNGVFDNVNFDSLEPENNEYKIRSKAINIEFIEVLEKLEELKGYKNGTIKD